MIRNGSEKREKSATLAAPHEHNYLSNKPAVGEQFWGRRRKPTRRKKKSLSSKSEADKEFTAGCCSQPTLRRKEINRGVPKITEGDSGLSVRRDNSQIYCKTEIGNSVTFTPFLNRWISVGDGVFIP